MKIIKIFSELTLTCNSIDTIKSGVSVYVSVEPSLIWSLLTSIVLQMQSNKELIKLNNASEYIYIRHSLPPTGYKRKKLSPFGGGFLCLWCSVQIEVNPPKYDVGGIPLRATVKSPIIV